MFNSQRCSLRRDNILKPSLIWDQTIHISFNNNNHVFLFSYGTQMEKFYHENPTGKVVITADANSKFGVPIEVLDKIREAGISNVTVAASKE